MLPTFPEIERISRQAAVDTIRAMIAKKSPIIGQIKAHIQHEGAGGAINRADGSVGDFAPRQIAAQTTLATSMSIYDFTTDELLKLLDGIAEQFARGQSEMLFDEMSKVTEETGNVVNAGGKPFDFEIFLEGINKMHHTFDANGQWHAPTVVVSPSAMAAMEKMTPEEKAAAEARLSAVLEEKKREFLDREASRILAG
ncbi:MAG: hypothetical protein IT547_14625 [Hyphomonadaceae bacterium]|nr:hypothetical protein [Hyphomonadaceae bacterium]